MKRINYLLAIGAVVGLSAAAAGGNETDRYSSRAAVIGPQTPSAAHAVVPATASGISTRVALLNPQHSTRNEVSETLVASSSSRRAVIGVAKPTFEIAVVK